MDIVIDFDGTVVSHEYPKVGRDIGAVPILRELVAQGHRLILFTMRCNSNSGGGVHRRNMIDKLSVSDSPNTSLDEAIKWFKKNDVPLFGIQTNPDQLYWTTSPKAYGNLIIDDAAAGCPLMSIAGVDRKFVAWGRMLSILVEDGFLDFNSELLGHVLIPKDSLHRLKNRHGVVFRISEGTGLKVGYWSKESMCFYTIGRDSFFVGVADVEFIYDIDYLLKDLP